MSCNPLIGISFTSVSFHVLFEKIVKIKKDELDYLRKVDELLKDYYYPIMEIDKNVEMMNIFNKYNNGKNKEMNFKTIFDYI